MSIKHEQEIKELQARLEELEQLLMKTAKIVQKMIVPAQKKGK